MAAAVVTQAAQPVLTEWRCARCQALLMKKYLGPGTVIETKCKRCDTFNRIEIPEAK